MSEMPEGWKNFKSLGRVQIDQQRGFMISTAAHLMAEMAEALEEAKKIGLGTQRHDTDERVFSVLKKWREWK